MKRSITKIKGCIDIYTRYNEEIDIMNIDERIKEIEKRLINNKEELSNLSRSMLRACAPSGYKTSTSYELHENIHGSKRVYDLFTYVEHTRYLESLIEIDERLLNNLKQNLKIKEDVLLLPKNADKIIYLKELGYNNTQISKLLDLTVRHVRRVVKKYNQV